MNEDTWFENYQNSQNGAANASSQPPENTQSAQNAGGSQSYAYAPVTPPPQRPKKDKRYVTFPQLIVSLLVVALIAGVIGVYGGSLMNNGAKNQTAMADTNANAPAIAQTPASADAAEPQATTKPLAQAGNADGATPSSGVIMSSTPKTFDSEGEMIRAAMSSVVGIDISSTSSYYGMTQEVTSGSGAGVIITADGYIVTNYHVIENATKITVYLQDGTDYEATVAGADSKTDLAVLKIEATGLPCATLGASGDVLVGDTVYAIGNPLGVLSSSVSRGIVSGLDRTITVEGNEMTLMQTDASVNPGNSGGGLFNNAGQLIGIVNSKSMGYDVEGIGFAIPIDSAKVIITDLMDIGYVSGRPYLGIAVRTVTITVKNGNGNGGGNDFNSMFGMFGFSQIQNYETRLQVTSVESGSCSEAGGLKEDDVILAFEGNAVTSAAELSSLLYEYNIGDTVTLTILRGEEQSDITLTLAGREG